MRRWIYTGSGVLVAMSMLVVVDVLFDLAACQRWPMVLYLVGGLLGAVGGWLTSRAIPEGARDEKWLRLKAIVAVSLGVLGATWLSLAPVSWESKCAHRYCHRIVGLNLLESPFPSAGSPDCRAMSMCLNEVPHSEWELRYLSDRMIEQGCAPP